MKNYFFLATSLPALEYGTKVDLTFDDLMSLYEMNLSKSDLAKVKRILFLIDLNNVKQLLRSDPLDPRGNFSEKELDEALATEAFLPEYLFETLNRYGTKEEQVAHYAKVFADFFEEAKSEPDPFLRTYFQFERNLRIVLTGFRAKRLGRDLAKELQYEDPTDFTVAQILALKDAPRFEFPYEFRDLGEKLRVDETDPMQEYLIVERYRFEQLKDLVEDRPFSLSYLLAYLIKFIHLENLKRLDRAQGAKILGEVVRESV